MANLDKINQISEIDREAMLRHIQELPDQIETAWDEIKDFVMPANYIKISNVVVLGMGGSAIGGMLARSLALLNSKVPVEVINDYILPHYVSSDSLVIAVSYSGSTEEPLTAFKEAGRRKSKLVAITMGGELGSLASHFKAPIYKINYGSQPRAALGYIFTSVLGVLVKLGVIDIEKDDVAEAVLLMRGFRAKLNPEVPTYQNQAKKIASTVQNLLPIVVGSGIMAPVAYRWVTQFNENSKHFAYPLVLPELCHNWLISLHYPDRVLKESYVLILQSKSDHERNRLRQNIIVRILQKHGVKFDVVTVQPSSSMLSEMLLMIYLGDYVSYYLALLKDVDPTSIDEIVFLKKQL